MTYELAKKLKDAGFPRWECGCGNGIESKICGMWKNLIWSGELLEKDGEYIYVPRLDKLIKACGDKFWSVMNDSAHDRYHSGGRNVNLGKKNWRATAYKSFDKYEESDGDTPEEAVANLWLALNKI